MRAPWSVLTAGSDRRRTRPRVNDSHSKLDNILEGMEKRSLQKIECIACEKRSKPDKHHVYVLTVKWSDGVKYPIYRKFQHFTDFHNDIHKLLAQYPSVDGPELPAHRTNILKKDGHKEKNERRKRKMEKYCEELLTLPQIDSVRETLHSFFSVWPNDYDQTDESEHSENCASEPSASPPKDQQPSRPLSAFIKPWRRATTTSADKTTLHKKTNSDPNVIQDILSQIAGIKHTGSGTPLSQPGSRRGSKNDVLAEIPESSEFVVLVKYSMEKFSVDAGDIIKKIECHDNGWWLVVKCSDGSKGWIPTHIIAPAMNTKVLPRGRSLLVPTENRLSCSCPDIADIASPLRTNHSRNDQLRRKDQKSSLFTDNKGSNGPRPRSKTNQSQISDVSCTYSLPEDDDESELYATIGEPIPSSTERFTDDSDEDPRRFQSDKRRSDISDDDPYSMARHDDPYSMARHDDPYSMARHDDPYSMARHDDPYSMARHDDPYSMGHYDDPYSMARHDDDDMGSGNDSDSSPYCEVGKDPPIYATVQKKRKNTNLHDDECSDPQHESLDRRFSDPDALYAKVHKPAKPKIVLTPADDLATDQVSRPNSIDNIDDLETDGPVPELPQRSYSLSDVSILLNDDQTLSNLTKEVNVETTLAPPLPERKARSVEDIDKAEQIYESVFPQTRTGTKNGHKQTKSKLPPEVAEELRKMQCYHGHISANLVSSTLSKYGSDGDFLIRPILSKAGELCISVKDGSHLRNFAIRFQPQSSDYLFAHKNFATISEIVQYYQTKPICFSKMDNGPLCLGSAVKSTTQLDGHEKVTYNTFL